MWTSFILVDLKNFIQLLMWNRNFAICMDGVMQIRKTGRLVLESSVS